MAFEEDLQHGEIAEEIVYNILKGYVTQKTKTGLAGLFDVRQLSHAQAGDYDFAYRTWDNIREIVRLDVKHDSRIGATNNFFIEDMAQMNRTKEIKEGWLHYSIADFIYYVDEQRELIYIFYLNDMRDYISKYKCRRGKCYDSNKIMEGYLVNLIDYSYKYSIDVMDYNGNFLDEGQIAAAF